MDSIDFQIDTPAGTFTSFTEAAAAGYPIACEAFALCTNAATVALPHPVLTAVPSCDRCAAKLSS